MKLCFMSSQYPPGFCLPENRRSEPWSDPLLKTPGCYAWRPEVLYTLARLRLAACAGSVRGLSKDDVDVGRLLRNRCFGIGAEELVLVVRWPRGDERLDQIVAATHENWTLLRTALETGSSVCSRVPTRGGGCTKKTVDGPVCSVEAWVWDGAVHYTDCELGIMDWMPTKPPGCKWGLDM